MTAVTNDASRGNLAGGLALAIPSALAFGLSGSLARTLMDAGWTAGAATLARVMIASAALVVPGVLALRGQWHLVHRNAAIIVMYGLFAVAGAQLCYFLAVSHLPVGVALLIEYTSPVAVVLWMWAQHGHRPGRLTAIGAMVAAVGLVLLLDVIGGGQIDLVGVAWALAAMVGAAMYFVISADDRGGLPPITLAAGGLLVAAVVLSTAAAVGVLPVTATRRDAAFESFTAPWWAVALALGLVTAAFAYVTGIAATRRLGPRLGSFVALAEVLAALVFAWLLLGQAPRAIQLIGAATVLTGVIVVKLGEGQGTIDDADLAEPAQAPPPPHGTLVPLPLEP